MAEAPSATIPSDLRDWIRDNAEPLTQVLGWLRANPSDFDLILALARGMQSPDVYGLLPPNGGDDDRRPRVRDYLASAVFGPCGRCFAPIVSFPDGQALGWPQLVPHRCAQYPDDVTAKPPKRERPVAAPQPRQPEQLPVLGGASATDDDPILGDPAPQPMPRSRPMPQRRSLT